MSNITKHSGKLSLAQMDQIPQVDTTPKEALTSKARLIFALDATASREPTWDTAANVQAAMFNAVFALGASIEVQLCYFRGYNECKASQFISSAEGLRKAMYGIRCQAGQTQVVKVLQNAITQNQRKRIHALVYVGDCFEEPHEHAYDKARTLAAEGPVPCFMFHEVVREGTALFHLGFAPQNARETFEKIASITGGQYLPFNANSADKLKQLLGGIAVFVSQGKEALKAFAKNNPEAKVLLLGKE